MPSQELKTRIELFWTHSALHIHRQLQQLGTLRKLPPGTGGCKEALALDEMLQKTLVQANSERASFTRWNSGLWFPFCGSQRNLHLVLWVWKGIAYLIVRNNARTPDRFGFVSRYFTVFEEVWQLKEDCQVVWGTQWTVSRAEEQDAMNLFEPICSVTFKLLRKITLRKRFALVWNCHQMFILRRTELYRTGMFRLFDWNTFQLQCNTMVAVLLL